MTYLVAAYVAIWCIMFVYLFSLTSRQRKLEKQISDLQRQLSETR